MSNQEGESEPRKLRDNSKVENMKPTPGLHSTSRVCVRRPSSRVPNCARGGVDWAHDSSNVWLSKSLLGSLSSFVRRLALLVVDLYRFPCGVTGITFNLGERRKCSSDEQQADRPLLGAQFYQIRTN